jgi:hypothetical protein
MEGDGACTLPVVTLKWEVDKLKAVLARFASICLRKASNSGLASNGSCFGNTAAKDLTDEDGELQFSRGTMPDSRRSPVGSTASAK